MNDTSSTHSSSRGLPSFLYGTAWKEDQTEELVIQALEAGFRGVDTANQRKHYHEAAVGAGLKQAMQGGRVTRADLFLQTKFTYARGQDHRLPYDPRVSIREQVRQSIASSLEHLGTDYLDSYLLHGPEMGMGLTANDWEAWGTMELMQKEGVTRRIGVSNVSAEQLEELCRKSTIKPFFVQNRCYPSKHWDIPVRQLCQREGIIYQGFNLIRDPVVWESKVLATMADRYQRTMPQIIYRYATQVGMLPLSGNTKPQHMREALDIFDFSLTSEDVKTIESLR